MCTRLADLPPPRMSPEWQLAEEMRRDLRVTVSPYELRMFIKYRWDHISKLAHEIHEAGL